MYLADLVNSGNIPVLEKLMAFSEARHQVLAENIANIDTPNYRTQQLDPKAFQAALRRAVETHSGDPRKRLEISSHEQFRQDEQGQMIFNPSREPVENILFHDRTNARLERLMADLAENVMAYNSSAELLNRSFNSLLTAIRGRI
ncbi:MAG: Flagellar basal body rod protein FlgB [Phycisphaerae bacterium]|nr:Flagellar basal body rod protein FlgB [Phycisphaerae bacterium]